MPTASEFRQRLNLAAVYATAAVPLNIVPLLIGALVTYLGLTEAEAGGVMTFELVAMAMTAFVLAPMGNRLTQMPIALLGCCIIIVATIATTQAMSTLALSASRIASGLGAGLLLLAANVLIARGKDPVKLYGTAVLVAAAVGMLFLIVIPYTAGAFELAGSYGPLIVLALVALPFARKVRLGAEPSNRTEAIVERAPRAPLVLGGLAILTVQALQAAYYAFVERRGAELNIDAATVGLLLAVAYASTLASTSLATWLGERWGLMWPMAAGLAGQVTCIVLVLTTADQTAFYILVIAQSALYFFAMPFQLAVGAHLDASGRFASAAAALFFLGLALGPVLGGILISSYGYGTLAAVISTGTAAAVLAFASAIKWRSTNVRFA